MPDHDPSDPLGDIDTEAERSSDPADPDTEGALLRERGPGAHEEKIEQEGFLREDDTAPGVDPDASA